MVYLKFSRVRIIKLKLCNGKSSCSDCAWCTYYVLHVCALLSSPCRRYKEAHHLLFPSRGQLQNKDFFTGGSVQLEYDDLCC